MAKRLLGYSNRVVGRLTDRGLRIGRHDCVFRHVGGCAAVQDAPTDLGKFEIERDDGVILRMVHQSINVEHEFTRCSHMMHAPNDSDVP